MNFTDKQNTKKGSLIIATKRSLVSVPALVTGQMAVHSFINDAGEQMNGLWSVSHGVSGYKVIDFCALELALECAVQLETLDWSCIRLVRKGKPIAQASEEWQAQLMAILRSYESACHDEGKLKGFETLGVVQ